jgi:hypothetical protein
MSDLSSDEVDALRRVHAVVSKFPGAFVIVGGWAAHLLRRHPLARPPDFDPLRTEDLDVAAPPRLSPKGVGLQEVIRQQGFVPDYRSEDRPPVTRYLLEGGDGFELEFIAPLRGGERRRDGTLDATADLQGVSAQKLRNVELLLVEPVEIPMPELGTTAHFLVTNPASFILQRLLVLPVRTSTSKRGKDALYIHDTLQLFTHGGRVHEEVVQQSQRVCQTFSRKQREQVGMTLKKLSDAVSAPVKEAARIAKESLRPDAPSPHAIAVTCRLGLAELMGEQAFLFPRA